MKDKKAYDKCNRAKREILEAKNTIDLAAGNVMNYLSDEEYRQVRKALKLLEKVTFGLEQQMANLQSE